MGLMDLFSGESGRNAAQWGAQNLQNSQNQVTGDLRNAATQGVDVVSLGATGERETDQQRSEQDPTSRTHRRSLAHAPTLLGNSRPIRDVPA